MSISGLRDFPLARRKRGEKLKRMEISSSLFFLSASLSRISPSASLSSNSSLFFSNGNKSFRKKSATLTLRRSNDGRNGLDCRCLFGLGIPELAVIAGVAALVFGPKKLPEIGRSIGKTVKSFQQVIYLHIYLWTLSN